MLSCCTDGHDRPGLQYVIDTEVILIMTVLAFWGNKRGMGGGLDSLSLLFFFYHSCPLKYIEMVNQCERKYSRTIKETSAISMSVTQHVLGRQQG